MVETHSRTRNLKGWSAWTYFERSLIFLQPQIQHYESRMGARKVSTQFRISPRQLLRLITHAGLSDPLYVRTDE